MKKIFIFLFICSCSLFKYNIPNIEAMAANPGLAGPFTVISPPTSTTVSDIIALSVNLYDPDGIIAYNISSAYYTLPPNNVHPARSIVRIDKAIFSEYDATYTRANPQYPITVSFINTKGVAFTTNIIAHNKIKTVYPTINIPLAPPSGTWNPGDRLEFITTDRGAGVQNIEATSVSSAGVATTVAVPPVAGSTTSFRVNMPTLFPGGVYTPNSVVTFVMRTDEGIEQHGRITVP